MLPVISEAIGFTLVGFLTGYFANELKHLLIKYSDISKRKRR